MTTTNITVKEMALGAVFTALIGVGAKLSITIPIQPTPMHFTLQWFFVLLAANLLGAKIGTLSVVAYLLLGLAGLPIFATGGGFMYLVKPTFGYLLGFAVAAYGTGKVREVKEGYPFGWLLFSNLIGMVFYYGCGMIYFYVVGKYALHMPLTGWIVLVNGLGITVLGDVALCVLAAVVSRRLSPLLECM